MRTEDIDRIRHAAIKAHGEGRITRVELSRIQTLCTNADTADLEGKDSKAFVLMNKAAIALETATIKEG